MVVDHFGKESTVTITRCPSVRGLVCILLAAAITGGVAAPAALAASCASVRSFTIRAEAKPGL